MLERGGMLDELEPARIGEAVKNMPSAALGDYPPGVAQEHELLRDVGLAQPQRGFKVADTGLSAANGQQDVQASRLAQ